MKINIVQAKTNDGKVIWSEAVEDSNTRIQIIVERKFFTEQELLDIENGKTTLSQHSYDPLSDFVNFGDAKAYHFTSVKFENFFVEMIEKDISVDDFVFGDVDYTKVVAAMVVYNTETKEMIFAEGSEIDGYDYHQVTLPKDIFTSEELSQLIEEDGYVKDEGDSIYLGEREAKDFSNEVGNIYIGLKYININ